MSSDSASPATSLAQDTLAHPQPAVIYRSTATQPPPPHSAAEFFELYGREPKLYDLEHKVGLAAIGRYKSCDDVPYGVIHGPTFHAVRNAERADFTDSGFQIMDLKARNLALFKARAKANITANKYRAILADAGFSIFAQPNDDQIVHSEQQPYVIKLDKDGNAQNGEDLTGRFLWNIFKADLKEKGSRTEIAPATAPDSRPQMSRHLTPQPPTTNFSPCSSLHSAHNTPPRAIAALQPSLRDDRQSIEHGDDGQGTEGEHEDESEQAHAESSDIYVIFDPDVHLPNAQVAEELPVSKQSRKRKISSQSSDDLEHRRSKAARTLPRDTPLVEGEADSAARDRARAKSPRRHSSLTPHLPRAAPTQTKTRGEIGSSNERSLETTKIHVTRQYGDSGPVRRHRGRSRSPARSDSEAAESRPWRGGNADTRYATRTEDSMQMNDKHRRSQAAQSTPLRSALSHDDSDLDHSRTSSSTPQSRSTFATSLGSRRSLSTSELYNEQSTSDASPLFKSAATDTGKPSSPAPRQLARRADDETIMSPTPQNAKFQGHDRQTGGYVRREHEHITEPHSREELHCLKSENGPPQRGLKRSREELAPALDEIFEEQQRSKRRAKQPTSPSTRGSRYEMAPAIEPKHPQSPNIERPTQAKPSQASLVQKTTAYTTTDTLNPMSRPGKPTGRPNPAENREETQQEKTNEVETKKEMTEVQKKIAARKAKRAAQPEAARYLPPARRTNVAGNVPTPNQNRRMNSKSGRR